MREETRPCPRPQRRSPSSPQPSDVPGGGLAGIVRHVAVPGCHVLPSGRGTAGGGQDVCGRPGAGSLPPWSWVGASFYPGNKGIPSSAESWEFAGDRLHKCCCKSCSREGLVRTLGCRPGLLLSLGVRGATPGAGRAPGARGRPASPLSGDPVGAGASTLSFPTGRRCCCPSAASACMRVLPGPATSF